jgi:hypothetical protein
MEKLLQYMENHTQSLSNLSNKMDDMDRRVRRMEQANHTGVQAVPPVTTADTESMDGVLQQRSELDDHRTAPHKLILLWPSVWPLLQDAGVNVNNTYVMEAEDRGILRIWTRGEGIDEHDGTQPGGPASPARSEESGEGSNAATPPDGLWGTGFPQTPISDIRRSDPYTLGGLKPDGSLDLDVSTINALYESYMRHMHIMHPFLDKQRLRKLFDHFIKRYCTGHPNLRQKFAVGSGSDSERPLKRQRSNGSTANPMGQDVNGMRKELPERSPGNAIVWLVLALGKICLHKDPLPGPVQDNRLTANAVVTHQMTGPGVTGSSPITNNIKPSPMSPHSTPTTQPTPSGPDGMVRVESRSRRSSFDGGMQTAGPRNLDIIPGLAYYAKAAEVLGDQGDGNDLVHAQMFLLAGLYKGQLARVKESMSWLSMAGRAVLNLLDRYKLYNDNYWTAHGDIRKQHEAGRLRIKDKRHNLIVLASWTCLQLESDILAELRLPSSNIKSVENLLLMPHNMPENEQENYEGLEATSSEQSEDTHAYNRMLMYYSSQMFLRKRLNQVHQEMYGDQCLNQTLAQVREMLSGHERILGYWRETLPVGLKWDDSDEPPADILDARLRAKYWGARYLVNRPFLDYALHIMPHAKDGRSIESVAVDSQGNPRDRAEIHLFKAIELMGEHEIWEASKRCVDAAMQSTIAFDGVPERLIITNIHGTAHA